LVDAFLQQFGFNLKMALARLDLQRIEMRNDESVKEYAMRLREITTQAYAPLL
jgi:hypothetical protein